MRPAGVAGLASRGDDVGRPSIARSVLASLVTLVIVAGMPGIAVARDRDGDGLRDAFERASHGLLDAARRDSDHDGVIDAAEDSDRDLLGNLGEQRYGLLPGDRDSDDDGTLDGQEDADHDGRSDAAEQDERPLPAGLRPTLAAASRDVAGYFGSCNVDDGEASVRRCDFGDPGSATRVAIMGDSHALQLVPALKRVAEAAGWHLVTLIKGGCPPVLGVSNEPQWLLDGGATCARWRAGALRWLRLHPPDAIVLTHTDGYAIVDDGGRRLHGEARLRRWRVGMRRTIEALPGRSELLVLGDTPKNRQNPIPCLLRHPGDMSACVSRPVAPSWRLVERAIQRVSTAKGALHRSLYRKVCPYDPCPLVQGQLLVYRDKSHLTATFARILAPSLRGMLRRMVGSTP